MRLIKFVTVYTQTFYNNNPATSAGSSVPNTENNKSDQQPYQTGM